MLKEGLNKLYKKYFPFAFITCLIVCGSLWWSIGFVHDVLAKTKDAAFLSVMYNEVVTSENKEVTKSEVIDILKGMNSHQIDNEVYEAIENEDTTKIDEIVSKTSKAKLTDIITLIALLGVSLASIHILVSKTKDEVFNLVDKCKEVC